MTLSPRDALLVRAFASAVCGRFEVLREAARAYGVRDRAWREMLLQVHVFAGFPRGVEVHGVLGDPAPEECDQDRELEHELADEAARRRGAQLFERIYADDAPAVRALLAGAHPDFAAWIEEHAYGRVLARPGLAADRRELLAVAALAALGQERQLASHARGALRCGATREEVEGVLDAIADLLEAERLLRAREIVARFAR